MQLTFSPLHVFLPTSLLASAFLASPRSANLAGASVVSLPATLSGVSCPAALLGCLPTSFDEATRPYQFALQARACTDAFSGMLRAAVDLDSAATVVSLDGRSA